MAIQTSWLYFPWTYCRVLQQDIQKRNLAYDPDGSKRSNRCSSACQILSPHGSWSTVECELANNSKEISHRTAALAYQDDVRRTTYQTQSAICQRNCQLHSRFDRHGRRRRSWRGRDWKGQTVVSYVYWLAHSYNIELIWTCSQYKTSKSLRWIYWASVKYCRGFRLLIRTTLQ